MRKTTSLLLYYGFARFLPDQSFPGSQVFRRVREVICRQFFASMGENINIGSAVFVADGAHIHIGSNSGIGSGSRVYGAIIGNDVIVGPSVVFFKDNHRSSDLDIPIRVQGFTEIRLPVVEDWAWIGERVMILPGRRIGKGAIVGAGAVVTRDVRPFEVVGGNPARTLGQRKQIRSDVHSPSSDSH